MVLMALVFVLGLLPGMTFTAQAVEGNPLPASGGSLTTGDYYLNGDTVLTTDIKISANATVSIDLNGYGLKGTETGPVITIEGGGKLTIKDSNPSAAHKYTLNNGLAVVDDTAEDGTGFTGGYITGGKNKSDLTNYNAGGGILVTGTNSELTINGGNIIGNTLDNSAKYGGGVAVMQGAKATMKSGSIIGNKSSTGGGVHVASGTFTLEGGTVSYNNATNGGGIYVQTGGNFTMNNGSIEANTVSTSGAGMFVSNGGTASMNGGTIKENSSRLSGGGVNVNPSATFTMANGAISNNKTTNRSGGGVSVLGGTFTMTGGSITGNTAPNPAYDGYGGGIFVSDASSSTFNLAGPAVIKDNKYGSGSSAKDSNVYLSNNKRITIQTGFTAPGEGKIGVTMASPGDFTTDYKTVLGDNATPEGHFSSDDTRYSVAWNNDETEATLIQAHVHEFTYTASGSTITAQCSASGCTLTSDPTLTIIEPTMKTYGQTGSGISANATLSGLSDFNTVTGQTVSESNIKYVGRDGTSYSESSTAPTDAGKYTAKITVGGQTASVNYEIAKANLTNVSVEQNETLTYTGQPQAPEVSASATAVNSQTVTFTYSKTENGEYGDMPTITNVSEDGTKIYYKASAPNHNDAFGYFTVGIAAAEPETPDGLIATYGQTLADVTLPEGWTWEDDTTSVGNVGTRTFKAKYTATDANYKDMNDVDLSVTVNKAKSVVTVAPAAKELVENGEDQELVSAGEATGGTMYYAIGTDATTAPTDDWSETIPAAAEVGTYYVWYKVVGDDNHTDCEAQCVTATISEKSSPSSDGYPVTVADSANGTVKANKDKAVENSIVTITATPDEGYEVDTVTVTDRNGKQITAAKNANGTYTFVMPDGPVNVSATFKKAEERPASPETTGVADWLVTDEHIVYIKGYPNDCVAPNDNITRAETAMIFYRLLKDQNVKITVSFPDVKEGDWYAEAVNTLASMKIINGYEDGTFAPNRPITRAEFCAIATRFAKATGGKQTFADVEPGYWAEGNIATASDYGWVKGRGNNMFAPMDKITRAEVATFVNNMLGRAADEAYVIANRDKLVQFTDLQDMSKWYYFDMVEATNAHGFTMTSGVEKWI